jgi:hypothetical protein
MPRGYAVMKMEDGLLPLEWTVRHPFDPPRAHHMRTPRMGLSCSHTLGRAAPGRAIARPSACTIFGKASLALVTERVDPINAKRRPES